MSYDCNARLLNTPLPSWVPEAAQRYLVHTECGLPIRELARSAGCHASTVSRQIRKFELRRDDLLVDEALRRLGHAHFQIPSPDPLEETSLMNAPSPKPEAHPDAQTLEREARRILRRLSEPGAVLAVATEMDKAVVVRDTPDGNSTRTAVVDRDIAQAMALKDWITCDAPGRISRYHITSAGRSALRRLLAEAENRAQKGFAEAQTPFAAQHQTWGSKTIQDEDGKPRRKRYNMAESPMTALARRRDKDGNPFLSDDLVSAGERLREDFELARMGPRVTQNWDSFLVGGTQSSKSPDDLIANGPTAARERVAAALRDLGPGLGDVALRCCCYLEGLEAAEKRMGWSARSGKIVLRIALQRLKRHYLERGQSDNMIG